MGLASRRICECVHAHPDITASALAEKMSVNPQTLKKQVRRLIERKRFPSTVCS